MPTENGEGRISEIPGEPTVSEVSSLLQEHGLAEAADKCGIQAAQLDRIRRKYDIQFSSSHVPLEGSPHPSGLVKTRSGSDHPAAPLK